MSYFGAFFGVAEGGVIPPLPPPPTDPMYQLYKETYLGFIDIEDINYQDATGLSAGKARFCDPTQEDLATIDLAGLQPDYAVFVVWDYTLSVRPMKGNGKIIRGDETTWTIVSLRNDKWRTQWRCVCRRDK